ncbi:SURF1 family protein [Bartonella sp. HY329]|uniref:SURF1 family protein n=1 Tax=unclassified Bartonella TaxID=2645622 RepID=UPI0021CA1550|nr:MULTISPECIES: SURF1 family protein [unclassified Bartonella]UXM95729.1 SURF1 family protein [Bartonella sp. HY329]UXN10054.1 SURF1 family protein [Bartonella sp. HY328]
MMTKTNNSTSKRKGFGFWTIMFLGLCTVLFCLFMALGVWQVERRAWKLDLIAKVEQRIHQPAVDAPNKDKWPDVTKDNDEYLPVKVHGHFLNDKEILITAVADAGAGYWLVVPFEKDDGTIVFINRGFVPMDHLDRGSRKGGEIDGETTIQGLLRMGEGEGYLMRKNNPQENRWFTRNIPAMAQKLGLNGDNIAPYFIDADKTPNIGKMPIGGLTVVEFRNNHLGYFLTWFTLAAGMVVAAGYIIYTNRRKA